MVHLFNAEKAGSGKTEVDEQLYILDAQDPETGNWHVPLAEYPDGSYGPIFVPKGFDLEANGQLAADNAWDLEWFKKQVQGGGPWDY